MRKNLTKAFVLAALFASTSAVEYPDVEGHCPMPYGTLHSNVKDTLNPHKLTGNWMNVFDRGTLNDNHRCYGVKLMHSTGTDEMQLSVDNDEHMKDIPKTFEYMKMTNVPDNRFSDLEAENPEENPQQPEDIDLIAFGYHAYHGFQLHFKDENDKSLAHVLHRDMNLSEHEDENLKEHGHSEEKEPYFNNYAFDAQFKRYAQVLDTDYDNFMVLYECFETAHYYDKENDAKLYDYEAWELSKSSSIDFNKWPQTSYTFDEEKVRIEPRHFENVKILWRPNKEMYRPDDPDMTEEEKDYQMENTPTPTYRYLKEDDHHKMVEKVEHLKNVIKEKLPKLDLSHYKLLDHHDGKCDYDAYEAHEDIEFHDESEKFGQMAYYFDNIPEGYMGEYYGVDHEGDGEFDETQYEDYDYSQDDVAHLYEDYEGDGGEEILYEDQYPEGGDPEEEYDGNYKDMEEEDNRHDDSSYMDDFGDQGSSDFYMEMSPQE